ncbi:MAG: CPBP family intramembrane metalloprotease [Gammaproteobacteria bacterium]|nr:CPBP family intramembrane metalloprotease [Gammaproteobacteria bacterium]
MGNAVFSYPYQEIALVGIMLFYPFMDRGWHYVHIKYRRDNLAFYFLLFISLVIFLLSGSTTIHFVVFNLLLAAVPEEWFFRAYFQSRLQKYIENNCRGTIWLAAVLSIVISSFLFAVVHAVMQGNVLLLPLIFIPSLMFGYIYFKSKDIVLVILVHLLSNVIFDGLMLGKLLDGLI